MKLEPDLEMRPSIAAVGMEVNGIGHHNGAGLQEPPCLRSEEVSSTSDFVNRPGNRSKNPTVAARLVGGPNHVMKNISPAHRSPAAAAFRNIIYLAHLDG